MPKINQEEYEVLKGLDDKWEWIARDRDGTLVMGAGKNERYLDGWFPPENIGDSLVADEINAVKVISEWENLFQFIQWEDEEPYNIAELIEEYLYDNQPKLFIDGQEQSFEFIEESEEKEVKKNIEWLKREIHKELESWQGVEGGIDEDGINEIMLLIDQLDEPEVLLEEWIERNTSPVDDEGRLYVWKSDLQNAIVPKQELPVIPDYVAEWIEKSKENKLELGEGFSGVFTALDLATNPTKDLFWIKDNQELFARAWLDGYTVEEKKYYIKIGPTRYARKYLEDRIDNQLAMFEKDGGVFTEKEILKLENGDKLWAFAVQVEELEE